MNALREAKARVRAIETAIKAGQAAEKAAIARTVAPRKKRAALEARLAKRPILTQAAAMPQRHVTLHVGDTREMSLARIVVNFGYRPDAVRPKAKKLAEELLSGGYKVGMGNGQDYTLRGALRRSVMVDPSQLVRVRAAEKAYKRAEAALGKAAAAVKAAYADAFAVGTKPDPVAIAADLAAVASIGTYPEFTDEEKALMRQGQEAQRELAGAQLHLRWLAETPEQWVAAGDHRHWEDGKGQVPDTEKPAECPCQECRADRIEAEKVAKRDAEIAALPTAMRPCPTHGRHRVSLATTSLRINQWTEDFRAKIVEREPEIDSLIPSAPRPYYEGDIKDVPAFWCLRDRKAGPRFLIDVHDWYVRLRKENAAKVKADKAAARRKPQPIKVTPTATGDPGVLDWICPSCTERNAFEVETDADGERYVECQWCGFSSDPDVVKTVAKAA